jgi:hypothetical protein
MTMRKNRNYVNLKDEALGSSLENSGYGHVVRRTAEIMNAKQKVKALSLQAWTDP